MTKTLITIAAAAMLSCIAAGGLWGESRYQAGYAAAERKAEQQQHTAAEQLREQQYQASQTYQAAKAEREAAERIRDETLKQLTQRPAYRRDCLDADGLRELNAAIGKK